MPPKKDPAREQLRAAYQAQIEAGNDVSLRWLADNSVELVGKPVSYDVVKYWSKEDNWMGFLATSLGNSPVLRDTKILFDKAKHDLETLVDWRARASAAKSFLALAKMVPSAYSLLIETDLAAVFDLVSSLLLDYWDDILPAQKIIFTNVRGQLHKMMDFEINVEAGGVSPDEVLLKERPK